MIDVLIVDDEKIVRKGLASFMPWQEYGMRVVGEANNGENALKFMETNKVDLLLTDLSMPVMSGIELMKEVKVRFPHIQIVVLTLHQDFEYIQEALRLGAIDYIAKTQLEKEQFEDVLNRIATLMKQKDLVRESHSTDELEELKELYVLYSLNPFVDDLKFEDRLTEKSQEADVGIWYWTSLPSKDKQYIQNWTVEAGKANLEYSLVCFKDLEHMDRKSILQLLRIYQKNNLFYDYDPLQPDIMVKSGEVLNKDKKGTSDEINEIKEKWLFGEWLNHEQEYTLLKHELKALRLPPIRLTRIFFTITEEWNRLYQTIMESPIVMEDFISSWNQFEKWLDDARDHIRSINVKSHFSPEIQASILKAMSLAEQLLNQPLTAGDIAKMVNMSNSYFSQCFKEILGKTYSDYIRDLRMDRAKEYLCNTTKTIQWVAEHVGYNDEKYFSRLFRKYVGVLPSEYRQHTSKLL
jgi:two-component system, response regulator YesN